MNLITLDDIKDYLRLTGTSYDNILTSFVENVESEIATYCNKNIHSTLTTVTLEGDGKVEYLFKNQPVISVNQITYRDGSVINGSSTTLASTEYEIRNRNGVDYLYNQDSFIEGYYYTIGYTYGYSTIPLDVKKAVIEMATTMFKESDWKGSKLNVSSETQNYPSGVSGSTVYKDMWKRWKESLKKYRKLPL